MVVEVKKEIHGFLRLFGRILKNLAPTKNIRASLSTLSYLFSKKLNKGLILRSDTEYNFSSNFVEYMNKNNIEEKLKKLGENLDEESKEIVRIILERYKYIFTHNLLERDKLFSKKELNDMKKIEKWFKKYKKEFILPIEHYTFSIFYYHHGLKCFLENDVNYVINYIKNKDFIDAGAFIGDSALIFQRYYNPKRVYSFEPEETNYQLLLKTISSLNKLENVIPVKKGLGDKEEILKLIQRGIGSYISEDGNEEIETTTIDKFVEENKLNVGLIKMDIEGYELEALKGAKKTIKKFKPILLISIYHRGKDFFEAKSCIEEITPNYKFIIRKLNPFHPFFDTTLIGLNRTFHAKKHTFHSL